MEPARQFPLSARQRALCDAITSLTQARNFPPSLREVAAAIDASLSRTASLARGCEAKGWLAHERGVSRSWRVLPDLSAAKPTKSRRK